MFLSLTLPGCEQPPLLEAASASQAPPVPLLPEAGASSCPITPHPQAGIATSLQSCWLLPHAVSRAEAQKRPVTKETGRAPLPTQSVLSAGAGPATPPTLERGLGRRCDPPVNTAVPIPPEKGHCTGHLPSAPDSFCPPDTHQTGPPRRGRC